MKAQITKLEDKQGSTEVTLLISYPFPLYQREGEPGYENALAARSAAVEELDRLHLGKCSLLQTEGG